MRAAMATSRESKHQARKVDQGGRRKGERETTARDREMRFVFTFVYLSLFAASQNESSERVFDENAEEETKDAREIRVNDFPKRSSVLLLFFCQFFFFCSLALSLLHFLKRQETRTRLVSEDECRMSDF